MGKIPKDLSFLKDETGPHSVSDTTVWLVVVDRNDPSPRFQVGERKSYCVKRHETEQFSSPGNHELSSTHVVETFS